MSRNHRNLVVFDLADYAAAAIYSATNSFPASERFGIQGQIRRAAVSTVTNIVEGSARGTTREYCHFLNVAHGSAAEVRYLVDLSARLGFLEPEQSALLETEYRKLCAALYLLIRRLRKLD